MKKFKIKNPENQKEKESIFILIEDRDSRLLVQNETYNLDSIKALEVFAKCDLIEIA